MAAADYRILTDTTGQRIAAAIEALIGGGYILAPPSPVPIPASGSSASYDLTGLTSAYQLVIWNFSTSAENLPPADLDWETYDGYFTITNHGGTTSESITPVFILPGAAILPSGGGGGTGVTGVKGNAESSYRQGNVNLTPANIGALTSTGVLTPSAAFSIPAAGSSVSYSMAGMTASHILTHWNFSASPENVPPANLTWTTYEGYFTITNNKGTTDQTIKPVFELPTNVSITGI